MLRAVIEVNQMDMTYRVEIQAINEHGVIDAEYDFEFEKGEVFTTESEYIASLACGAVQHALDSATQEFYLTDNVDSAVYAYDMSIQYSPFFNYPEARIRYA